MVFVAFNDCHLVRKIQTPVSSVVCMDLS